MKTFATDTHRLHFPDRELLGGEFVRAFECPERWQHVVDAFANRGFSAPEEPQALPEGCSYENSKKTLLAFSNLAVMTLLTTVR